MSNVRTTYYKGYSYLGNSSGSMVQPGGKRPGYLEDKWATVRVSLRQFVNGVVDLVCELVY